MCAACRPPDAAVVPPPDNDGVVPPSVARVSGYGLPFAAGTSVKAGDLGLHGWNFGSVQAGHPPKAISFTGAKDTKASIDLWAPAGTPVYPVADGAIVSAWAACDIVVVSHPTGEWSEYLHIKVDPARMDGERVTTATRLGIVLPAADATACNQQPFEDDHLHLAFARPTSHGPTPWVEMAGHILCDRTVDADGNIGDWEASHQVSRATGVRRRIGIDRRGHVDADTEPGGTPGSDSGARSYRNPRPLLRTPTPTPKPGQHQRRARRAPGTSKTGCPAPVTAGHLAASRDPRHTGPTSPIRSLSAARST